MRVILTLGAAALAALTLAGCGNDDRTLQGWVEADLIFVSPDEAGRVENLAVREGDTDVLLAVATEGEPPPLSDWPGLGKVLTGQTVRLKNARHGSLIGVPMFYQNRVLGTLAIVTPAEGGVPVGDSDVDVLAVLANNAAIAMENARLFEQEFRHRRGDHQPGCRRPVGHQHHGHVGGRANARDRHQACDRGLASADHP